VVLRDSLLTIASGLAVGLLHWFPLLGLAKKLVYGLSPHDPVSLGAGSALLLVGGLLDALLSLEPSARVS
jgi:hypothetical protein